MFLSCVIEAICDRESCPREEPGQANALQREAGGGVSPYKGTAGDRFPAMVGRSFSEATTKDHKKHDQL